MKTQPATGETYPKSDLFNKAQEWLTLDEAAEVIRQHNITLLPADLIRHSFSWRNRSFCL
ncbi:hypothetical protein DMS21_27695 [Klebsiella variicola]|nr:hypothetical protein DMS21_27695 [Klebsiella variicola]